MLEKRKAIVCIHIEERNLLQVEYKIIYTKTCCHVAYLFGHICFFFVEDRGTKLVLINYNLIGDPTRNMLWCIDTTHTHTQSHKDEKQKSLEHICEIGDLFHQPNFKNTCPWESSTLECHWYMPFVCLCNSVYNPPTTMDFKLHLVIEIEVILN